MEIALNNAENIIICESHINENNIFFLLKCNFSQILGLIFWKTSKKPTYFLLDHYDITSQVSHEIRCYLGFHSGFEIIAIEIVHYLQ